MKKILNILAAMFIVTAAMAQTDEQTFMKGMRAFDDDRYNEAVGYFKDAASNGYAPAQLKLGLCYFEGDGVKRNYQKAVEWYEKAANQGNVGALYQLAHCYDYGYGVKEDQKKALELFEIASKKGDGLSTFRIGDFYANGLGGLKEDKKKAFDFYKKAAKQGLSRAKTEMGICYMEGIGVKKNEKLAKKYLEEALAEGDDSAYVILKNFDELFDLDSDNE